MPDSLTIHFQKPRRANGELTMYAFQDHGHQICYIPSLNLSGYGNNYNEAMEMLRISINDFFDNLVDLDIDKAAKELQSLGWKKKAFFPKRFTSDSYVDQDGMLKNFNLPKETPVKSEILTV